MTETHLAPDLVIVEHPPAITRAEQLTPEQTAALALGAEIDRQTRPSTKADNTVAAYASDWHAWRLFCQSLGIPELIADPASAADAAVLFIRSLAERGDKYATIARRVSGVSSHYTEAGLPAPAQAAPVREALKATRRDLGQTKDKAAPATYADICAMVDALDRTTPKGRRDAAMLLVGYGWALRSSELVALSVEDLEDMGAQGVRFYIARRKTDQDGKGTWGWARMHHRRPDHCPARALRAWLADLGPLFGANGPVFRQIRRGGHIQPEGIAARNVTTIVRNAARNAGLDPDGYSGHSLRRGLLTEMADRSATTHEMMAVSGHRSPAMVNEYVERSAMRVRFDLMGFGEEE